MRVLSSIAFCCCLLASNSVAQRGGGFRGGGFGGFHAGAGGFHGGFGGFNRGFNRPFIGNRGWGYRAGYGYPAWGLGFPYWPVYPTYPYYGTDDGYSSYSTYEPSPNVTVVYPQQPPSVVYMPDARDSEARNLSSSSPMYLMAFQDHTIRAAIAYWVDGPTLHYVDLQHEQTKVPLEFVDRNLTIWLNRERNVAIVLPERSQAARAENVEQGDVTFAFNSGELDNNAKLALDLMIRKILAMPQPVVELVGSTDTIGSKSYNLALSRRRAEAVQRYMVLRNVPLSSIHIIGVGEEGALQGFAANRETSDLNDGLRETIPRLARSVHIQVYPAGLSEARCNRLP